MDEDTTNFYYYNLNVLPEGKVHAVSYLRSILKILGTYNDVCKSLYQANRDRLK